MQHHAVFPLLVLAATGCSPRGAQMARDTIVVFEAASLAVPMHATLDSFARQSVPPAVVLEEHGASIELARRVTELHRVPDVIALADQEVFPQLLMPGVTRWYATFARNRMVVAYTSRSRHAAAITSANWPSILLRDDVLLGRTDPSLAPAGYRALLVYRLAETFYREPGLAARLEARTPSRMFRGNAAELAALLAAGELDYIVDYESLAIAQGFRYVTLPPQIDLGDAQFAATYGAASVRVERGEDSVELRGSPILYGVSMPRAAPHRAAGERFVNYLLGSQGQTILRAFRVDALARPLIRGDSIPPALTTVGLP